jgi:hypothetical protein
MPSGRLRHLQRPLPESRVSQVAPTGQAIGGLRSRDLIERDALRPGIDELHSRPERDLEAPACGHAASSQLGDRLIEVCDAVDEDGLVTFEVLGK